MTDFPDLKIKALVNFPANVIGDAGIDVVKTDGTYHLNIAYDDFAPVVTGIVDPLNQTVLMWNTVTEQYSLTPVSVLTSGSQEFLVLSGDLPYLDITSYSGGANYGPWFYANMHRGTLASPTAVQTGDIPFGMSSQGYDGAVQRGGNHFYTQVDGPVADHSVPMAWVFETGTSGADHHERIRFSSAGEILINTPISPMPEPTQLSIATDAISWGCIIAGGDIFGFGPYMALAYTHNTNVNVHTLVSATDQIGTFDFLASNGSSWIACAEMFAAMDGVCGPGSMPAKLVFRTVPSGSDVLVERLQINNAGHSIFKPGSTTPPTLTTNGQFVLTPTSNTNLRISYRGSDGTTRVGNITLS